MVVRFMLKYLGQLFSPDNLIMAESFATDVNISGEKVNGKTIKSTSKCV